MDVQNSFNISDRIDGSPTFYNITYSDTTFGSTCGLATIPAFSCEDGICTHTFDIFTSSCSPSTGITVTVFAMNILGNGPTSVPAAEG